MRDRTRKEMEEGRVESEAMREQSGGWPVFRRKHCGTALEDRAKMPLGVF